LEIDLSSTFGRFDANRHNHYRFRREKCGHVFDVDEPINRELDNRLADKTCSKMSHHRLELIGYDKSAGKAETVAARKDNSQLRYDTR
jgi:Fe2+ or Zn2+ uptake regulation protein